MLIHSLIWKISASESGPFTSFLLMKDFGVSRSFYVGSESRCCSEHQSPTCPPNPNLYQVSGQDKCFFLQLPW